MTYAITTKSLTDSRRGFLGWGIGIAGATALYTASFALIKGDAYAEVIESFPPEILDAFGWNDITSPTGYLGSTVFGLVVPILMVIFAIGLAARYLAGDEEAGTLELTLTHPVSRTSIVLQRSVAMAVAGLAAAALVFVSVLVVSGPVGVDIPIGNMAAASLQLGLLTIAFGAFTLAAGALIGRRAIAIGAASALAVFAYMADTVLAGIESMEWIENLSLFHYYDGATALTDGFNVGGSIVLVVVTAVFTGLAIYLFNNRDVGTA